MKRCRKRRYRDEVAAKLALATIQRQDKSHRAEKECRAYYCPQCRAHHLTHLKEWKE